MQRFNQIIKKLGLTYTHRVTQPDTVLEDQPGQGTLDIDAFSKADPYCWQTSGFDATDEEKYLDHIITDPTKLLARTRNYWNYFHDKCAIYILNKKELIKINTLDELKRYAKFATPMPDEKEFYRIAANYHLAKKQVVNVHFALSVQLLYEWQTELRLDFPRLNPIIFQRLNEEIFDQTMATVPKGFQVILHLSRDIPLSRLKKFTKAFHVIGSGHPADLKLSQETIRELDLYPSSFKTAVTETGMVMPIGNYKKEDYSGTNLELNCQILYPHSLLPAFKQIPQITSLKVKNVWGEGVFPDKFDFTFPQLTKLTWADCIDFRFSPLLLHILKTSPLLEEIEIRNSLIEIGKENHQFNLPKLREVVISYSARSCENLPQEMDEVFVAKLIEKSTELEQLTITNVKRSAAEEAKTVSRLAFLESNPIYGKLQSLDLQYLTGQFVTRLLMTEEKDTCSSKYPSLTHLRLSDLKYCPSRDLAQRKLILPQLKTLELKSISQVNTKDQFSKSDNFPFFDALINDASMLKKIKLEYCPEIKQLAKIAYSLETLHLDPDIPEALLNAAPNMTEIDVFSAIHLDGKDITKRTHLKKIKIMDIANLEIFFQLNPDVESLSTTIWDKVIIPENISFTKVRELDIRVIDLKDGRNAIDRLLKLFPNVERLRIDNEGDSFVFGPFPKSFSLKELRLKNIIISPTLVFLYANNKIQFCSISKGFYNNVNVLLYMLHEQELEKMQYLQNLSIDQFKLADLEILLKKAPLEYLKLGCDHLDEKETQQLYDMLSGKHFKKLTLKGLRRTAFQAFRKKFPHVKFVKNPDTVQPVQSVHHEMKHHFKLDSKVTQEKITELKVELSIWPKSFPHTEYREIVYPKMAIVNDEIIWLESEKEPVRCKIQPARTHNLYDKFTRELEHKGFFYRQATLKYAHRKIALTGISQCDDIEFYQAEEDVIFSENSESKQFYAETTRSNVKIAYAFKPKQYFRNTIRDEKPVELTLAKKLVASFRLEYEEKEQKFSIIRSGESEKVDDITLFLAAIALTYDEEIFRDKKLDFSALKGIKLLDAIRKYTTGACRHQASFIWALANALNIPCQIILGGGRSHAFVQFELHKPDGKIEYHSERLGGYPAKTEVIDMSSDFMPVTAPLPDEKKEVPAPCVKKSFAEFYQTMMAEFAKEPIATARTRLFYVSDDAVLRSCKSRIMEETTKLRHRCFYIDDLSKLSETTIAVRDGQEHITGSALQQFFQQATEGDILIIRAQNDFARLSVLFNALDVMREIGNMAIPPCVTLICLMEKSQIVNEYAFLRRFSKKPASPDEMLDDLVLIRHNYLADHYLKTKPHGKKVVTKDFFGGDTFKQDLHGTPVFSATGAAFQKGLLSDVLDCKDECYIEMTDSPDTREFKLAMEEIVATGRAFVNGEWRVLPKIAIFPVKHQYGLSPIPSYELLSEENIHSCQYILNHRLYSQFFMNYGADAESARLIMPDGLLKLNAGKTITLRVTRPLKNRRHWDRLYAEAKKHNVEIRRIVDPHVDIPDVKIARASMSLPADEKSGLVWHLSDTPYESVTQLQDELKADLVINVCDKHTESDLIQKLRPIKTKEYKSLPKYHNMIGDVITLLRNGKKILLVGDLSDDVAQTLETLLANYLVVNGKPETVTGQLHILTRNKNLFHCIKPRTVATKSTDHKVVVAAKEIEIKSPDEQAERMGRLCAKLRTSRCVLIEGPTAAGKSSAVRRFLGKYYGKPVNMVEGFENVPGIISQALKDKDTDYVVLMDEADLERKAGRVSFNMFEGAYNAFYPNLLANLIGNHWPPNLKIIFTGNGKSYQGREVQQFFERHPEMRIHFAELSPAYIKEFILKDILNKLVPDLKMSFDKMIEIFFAASSMIRQPYVITLRNWTKMCLRLAMSLMTRPDCYKDEMQAAQMAAYDELEAMVRTENLLDFQTKLFGTAAICKAVTETVDAKAANEIQTRLDELESQRAAQRAKDRAAGKQVYFDPTDKFVLTQSRFHAARHILDELLIRHLRLRFPEFCFDGTRGVVLQGESEAGKTFMLKEILEAFHFVSAKTAPDRTASTALVYTSINDLDSAFEGGSVLIENELNAKFLEKTLNGPLTAVNRHGKKAAEEGFLLFGTQNTLDHHDRVVPAPSFVNRLNTVHVTVIPPHEFPQVLHSWGMDKQSAQTLLQSQRSWTLSTLRDAARRILLAKIADAEKIVVAETNPANQSFYARFFQQVSVSTQKTYVIATKICRVD